MASLGEVMSKNVKTVDSSTTISAATEMMVRGRFGSVLVMQGELLEGIFTERDVLRAVTEAVDLQTETIAGWMTEDPITRGPEADTEEAADIMISGGFRHLPIAEDDRLLGIVSLRDVLSARIRRT